MLVKPACQQEGGEKKRSVARWIAEYLSIVIAAACILFAIYYRMGIQLPGFIEKFFKSFSIFN